MDAVAGLGTDVVHHDLQVHLSLAAKPLDIGQEVTLIGADRAAQSVVVLKRCAEPEWKYSGAVKAAGDHASVVTGSRLSFRAGETAGILGQVLGDDDSKIGGGKEKGLISEEAGDPGERHRTTMTS
jgi:hypothetical protein